MKIIGLTGGVGTGKSTAASILKETYGFFVIMADTVGHLAMEPGSETYHQITSLFGNEIIDEKGSIDRKKLGDIVFSAPEKLEALNAIIHPFVRKKIKELLAQAEEKGYRAAVLESAILLETNYQEWCDEIWLVTAREEIRFKRLSTSRGYTMEKFQSIMKQQRQEEEFRGQAGEIIENNGDEIQLEKELKRCVAKLLLED